LEVGDFFAELKQRWNDLTTLKKGAVVLGTLMLWPFALLGFTIYAAWKLHYEKVFTKHPKALAASQKVIESNEDLRPAVLPLVAAKGLAGVLEVYEDKVILKRAGLWALSIRRFKGDKTVPMPSITSIQFKPVGKITSGYIQLGMLGGIESPTGIFDAAKDENTIMFAKSEQPMFEKAKRLIEARIGGKKQSSTSSDRYSEIERLSELKKKGIISDKEFQAKKKQLLELR